MSTELVFILDKSGSMTGLRDRTISDFNELLGNYRSQFPDAYISLVQFDHNYEPNYLHLPVGKAAPLTHETYQPRGNTALYDAVCRTIDEVGLKISRLPTEEQWNTKVVVAIFTDGQENWSKTYSAEDVKRRIEHQQSRYNWQFTYMGANQDAILAAGQIGISAGNALKMSNTAVGRASSNKAFYGKFAAFASGSAECLTAYNSSERSEAMK